MSPARRAAASGPFILYLITNTVNGKKYIGVTGQSLSRRWANHRAEARCGSTRRFCRAIRKHGPDAFMCEVLSTHTTAEEAKAAEVAAIHCHGTAGRRTGYNATLGGDGTPGHVKSAEARARISAARARNPITAPEQCVPVVAAGVPYPSMSACARALGLSVDAVRRRVDRVRGDAAGAPPAEIDGGPRLKRRRGYTRRRKARCKRGHDLTGPNGRRRPNGATECKECRRAADRKRRGPPRPHHYRRRPVEVDGQRFPSLTAAAAHFGRALSSVSKWVQTGRARHV